MTLTNEHEEDFPLVLAVSEDDIPPEVVTDKGEYPFSVEVDVHPE